MDSVITADFQRCVHLSSGRRWFILKYEVQMKYQILGTKIGRSNWCGSIIRHAISQILQPWHSWRRIMILTTLIESETSFESLFWKPGWVHYQIILMNLNRHWKKMHTNIFFWDMSIDISKTFNKMDDLEILSKIYIFLRMGRSRMQDKFILNITTVFNTCFLFLSGNFLMLLCGIWLRVI